ncbi:TPA: glycerophosphodiester phosphodiesterase family protein [Enterococcus faecalis]|nr:glycerophosphodiester phosphodiesterase family protein [Listeria monocytogenes]EIL9237273.1 glycerophosphodiester phosphodiesterase family protein [Listeria monocytogenes]
MKKLNKKFDYLLKNKKFLIMLHRGAHGGNIIENTSNAVNIAIKQGTDIVEIDISKSTDGYFYVFHDGGELRLLNEKRNINKMSSSDIESKFYYNELGALLNQKVQRLSELFLQVPTNVFINIDRSWEHWKTFIPYLDNFKDRHEYFILKSPIKKEFLDILETHPIKYMYLPIIYNLEELSLLETYKNINVIGFEIIENSEDFNFIKSSRFDNYKKGGYMFMANSINLDDDTQLFGSLSDYLAITQDPILSWGKMLKLGINTIQTDWVDLLFKYRNDNF